MALWEEYEAGSTEAARLVKDLDKLDMLVQADWYERERGVLLQDFFDSTLPKFQTELVTQWVRELTEDRNARLLEARSSSSSSSSSSSHSSGSGSSGGEDVEPVLPPRAASSFSSLAPCSPSAPSLPPMSSSSAESHAGDARHTDEVVH